MSYCAGPSDDSMIVPGKVELSIVPGKVELSSWDFHNDDKNYILSMFISIESKPIVVKLQSVQHSKTI